MNNTTKEDSTIAVKVVCAILFLLFTTTYLYYVQAHVLEMVQYAWSDGATVYDPLIGAGVVTAVLCVLTYVVNFFVRLPHRCKALLYFPAFLALGLLTAVRLDDATHSVTTSPWWLAFAIVAFIAYFPFASLLQKSSIMVSHITRVPFLSMTWWTNIMCLVVMMFMTYSMGNSDRSLHTRLALEHSCKVRQWDEALAYGIPQYDDSEHITLLRMMALANEGRLGDSFFKYDVTPVRTFDAHFVLSDGYRLWQTIGFVPYNTKENIVTVLRRELERERQHRLDCGMDSIATDPDARTKAASSATGSTQQQSSGTAQSRQNGTAQSEETDSIYKPLVSERAKDMLLCALLMNRDLKGFATELSRYYTDINALPQHYREACVMYYYIYKVPVPLDKEGKGDEVFAAEIADFKDFQTLQRSQQDATLRNAALREAYFGTYWYYYVKNKGIKE